MDSSFWQWWQDIPQRIDPVIFALGPIQVRYYGLMFLSAFLVVYLLLAWRIKHQESEYHLIWIEQYFSWVILGAVLGGRLGYVLLYDPLYYLAHPFEIILPVDVSTGSFTGISGMSYHGGLIGGIMATFRFCKVSRLKFWEFVDFVVPAVPLGYTLGRIGNFLNGELFGRVTEHPWGMYFAQSYDGLLRHPSQLYEASGEGLLLFCILWPLRNKSWPSGVLSLCYVVGYGCVRIVLERFRQPDGHIGFIFGQATIGQLYCLAMIVIGSVLMLVRIRKETNGKPVS